ncbi:hypothetical protein CL176_05470 [Suicoccus acidiformans]|uniref:DUF1541 domain-containing protein n=1 Tax=Suicoccus acidiformans TaxID=2036206 RepID=A0A347WK84_9LACT|nr:YdhK family protein [Suicoccus acidiformans]AXY25491.1 hypothetical protein CL176_05470 [Suicoccus acidiformans]
MKQFENKQKILALAVLLFGLKAINFQSTATIYAESNEASQASHEADSGHHGEGHGHGHAHHHGDMEHNRNETKPINMTEVENPKYPVGSKVIITDAHMDIMQDVEAEVSGAYDTTLYTVTYDDGSMVMADHKWVVQEEIESANDSYEIGDAVILKAQHMEGMEGQEAVITGKFRGPAYMVNFEPNDGSEPFTNHKWVSEIEITAADKPAKENSSLE